MVKADVKQDYYAALELPPTADNEDIKRQFRLLAKQYHPDRNPGREMEVVPKFQAVQTAHEILSDPQQKIKYDLDRAKLARPNAVAGDYDPYNFKKPPGARNFGNTTSVPFPPPPKKRPNPKPQFPPTPGRTPTGSASADKFAAFTRAANATNQWDRTRFDEAAAKAEALRGFHNMKTGQASPQVPPRPGQHPTAPRPATQAPSPDISAMGGPSLGFPGMSRAANPRKGGYAPMPSGPDEATAPPPSAYASYHRGERPHAATAQSYNPGFSYVHSPPMTKSRPAVSPLRHAKSSGFEATPPERPSYDRNASKYASRPGEKTNINGGLGRSASVRNSPIDPSWEDHGSSGPRRPQSHYAQPPPRHHSASPKSRPGEARFDYSSSESSSSEDEQTNLKEQRKFAVPRKPRPQSTTGPTKRVFPDDDPALTGQFPNTNYTKVVDDSNYYYPPPQSQEGPTRQPFADMTTPMDEKAPGANGNGSRHVRREGFEGPKYVCSSRKSTHIWPERWGFAGPKRYYLNGFPPWAVPSSVFPVAVSPIGRVVHKQQLKPGVRHETPRSNNYIATQFVPTADLLISLPTHTGKHAVPEDTAEQSGHNHKPFSATDWEDHFANRDDLFRPDDSQARRSPSKTSRTGPGSTSRGRGMSRSHETVADVPQINVTDESMPSPEARAKAAAFQAGRFSAEDWAQKFKNQTWQTPNNELNTPKQKPAKRGLKSNMGGRSPGQTATDADSGTDTQRHSSDSASRVTSNGVDPMDLDDLDGSSALPDGLPQDTQYKSTPSPLPTSTARRPSTNGVNLEDLTRTAPFAPSATGLKDLDDLATSLPFESKAAQDLDLKPTTSATIRDLALPRPPRPVIPPTEEQITQEAWEQYVRSMNNYMDDWNAFNSKMIEHFRSRQEQVNGRMIRHWMSAVGDGPSASAFEDAVEHGQGRRAGYAMYMRWLEEDAKCRTAWDYAYEQHRKCFEDLGRIRDRVKAVAL